MNDLQMLLAGTPESATSASPPQSVDRVNAVEDLDNIRSNVAAVMELGSNNYDAFDVVGPVGNENNYNYDSPDEDEDTGELQTDSNRFLVPFSHLVVAL